MQLIAADALLAARHQERGLKPDMQRNVTAFENCPDANSKLLPTGVALLTAKRRLAGFAYYAIKRASPTHSTAMRADDAVRPDDRFQAIKGGLLVLEIRLGKNAVYTTSLAEG
jgi:hypothetical protein